MDATSRYLELLKRALLGEIAIGSPLQAIPRPEHPVKREAFDLLRRGGVIPARAMPDDRLRRHEGRDWPRYADTMIGRARLDNIESCARIVIREGVAGDFIEAGVWRGGASILMRGILAVENEDRRVFAADSFEGLPAPDAERYPADTGYRFHEFSELAVSVDEVRANFERYGLLDDSVVFVKGWFRDTLPGLGGRWALIRLDGDLYESTMDGLVNLYPRLEPGGFVLIDDYGDIPACKQAVEDYRTEHKITDPVEPVDWTGAFWRKSS
jgi:O-methyltransferase